MKKSRYTEEQIIGILKEQEAGVPVAELCRKHGLSDATFYFALYDDLTQTLSYTNAGHLAPMLLRGSAITTLDSTGTVVGAFPIARYGEKHLQLQQGDMLVAYRDPIGVDRVHYDGGRLKIVAHYGAATTQSK